MPCDHFTPPRALPLPRLGVVPMFLLLLALLLASQPGCAPEDEELLVAPQLPVAVPIDGGSWENWPLLAAGLGISDLAAWSASDLLLSGGGGTVLRLQDGAAWNLNIPVNLSVIAIATGPQGQAFALDFNGQCFAYDGRDWHLDWPYGPAQWAEDLWHDGKETLVVAGRIGLVAKQGGRWIAVEAAVGQYFRAVWGRGHDDIWAVGRLGKICRFNGEEWKLSAPFGEQLNLETVIGDADGRVAITTVFDEIYYHDGDRWQYIESPGDLAGVYVAGGSLHYYSHRNDRYVWDGDTWQSEGGRIPRPGCQAVHVAGDTLLFAGHGGWVERLVGGEWATVNEELELIDGLVLLAEGPVLLTRNGWLARRKEGAWDLVFKLGAGSLGLGHSLAQDDQGRLLALIENRLSAISATGEQEELPGAPWSVQALYPLADGTVCLFQNHQYLWALREGIFTQLGEIPGAWSPRLEHSVAGSDLERLWVLTYSYLARFDGTGFRPVLPLDNSDYSLAYDEQAGALLYGSEGIFAVNEKGEVSDLTPLYVTAAGKAERPQIQGLGVSPDGGWLAVTDDRTLLRRIDGVWQQIPGYGGGQGTLESYWYPLDVLTRDSGEAYVSERIGLWHYDDRVQGSTRWPLP